MYCNDAGKQYSRRLGIGALQFDAVGRNQAVTPLTIEILPWRRTQVLALQVHSSPSRPHHVIREGPAAGVYVRVGSMNRRADAELTEELRRFARGEGFDEQPMSGLNSEALDFRAASESFAYPRATRTRLARLVDRGLVREIGTGPQDPRRRCFLAERGPA